jgi:hypothetical protein
MLIERETEVHEQLSFAKTLSNAEQVIVSVYLGKLCCCSTRTAIALLLVGNLMASVAG